MTIPKVKLLADNQLRVISTGSIASVIGTAQNKGTATDMMVTIIAGTDGATAVGGTVNVVVQGSNVTATATSNWSSVAADKGTLAAITASGTQALHFAQLQSQFYRVSLNCTTGATADVSVVWAFMPVQDSFDSSVQ